MHTLDIGRILSEKGWSQTRLADAVGISRGYMSQLVSGQKQPSHDMLLRLADALDVQIGELYRSPQPTVSLAGKVGAGAVVELADPYEKGAGPQVELPPGLPNGGIVAVEVEGDSMEPAFFSGDLLFYTRYTHDGVPTEAIGRPCVAEDAEGKVWVKQVKRGDSSGLFNLISLNPGATTMWNVRLKWAAPVRLHWPAELARKI